MMRPVFYFTLLFSTLTISVSAQAVRVKDINPGDNSSDPANMRLAGDGTLYFFATDGTSGSELWKSDGTEAGTVLVKDINAGPSSSQHYPDGAIVFGSLYCFYADDGIHGYELWKSDGTVNGTSMVVDLRPGQEGSALSEQLVLFNNLLYFPAFDGSGPASGFKLFRSNATASGTQAIYNAFTWRGLTVIKNGSIYFNAYGSFSKGYEPWKSNGTTAGTVLIKDICPETGHGDPSNFTLLNNQIFFTAKDVNNGGKELWKTDGTDAGTVLVKDIYPGIGIQNTGPSNLTVLNGLLYFFADDGVHGAELWKSDGTEAGTEMVADINPGPTKSACCFMQAFNGKLYFGADDGVHGKELFESDGTTGGTTLLKDIFPGSAGSNPQFSVVFDGKLFFPANDGQHGTELWATDGSIANTALVQDIYVGSVGSYPSGFVSDNTHLYFTASDDATGTELWKYNAAALPVTLRDFSAKVQGQTVQLFWQTEVEENNKGFEVQRSLNLKEWSDIGFVAAKNEAAQYQFVDRSPLAGVNYYRLKQMDHDQRFDISKVVSVQFNTNVLKFFQVDKTLHINGAEPNESLTIYLSDMTGKILLQQVGTVNAAGEYLFSIQDLQPGIYTAVLYNAHQMQALKISVN